MSDERQAAGSGGRTRPLTPDDLEAVIALDRRQTGRTRRGFFEKRLDAVWRRPDSFVAVAAENAGKLVGFAIARMMEGEFGAAAPVAALDVIGVDPALRGRGLGNALLAAATDGAKALGARELVTEIDWTNASLLGFFAAEGFAVAPRLVLERPLGEAMP